MNKEEQLLLNIIEEVTRKYNDIMKEHLSLLKKIEKKLTKTLLQEFIIEIFLKNNLKKYLKTIFKYV